MVISELIKKLQEVQRTGEMLRLWSMIMTLSMRLMNIHSMYAKANFI